MGVAKTDVSGFADLDRQLAKLAAGVPEDRLRAHLHEGGELIAEEQRRLAPVDTGDLRDSIDVVDDKDASIAGKLEAGGVGVYIGPVGSDDDGPVYYAKYQEQGTSRHAAQPFLRPGFINKRQAAEDLIAWRLAEDLGTLAR